MKKLSLLCVFTLFLFVVWGCSTSQSSLFSRTDDTDTEKTTPHPPVPVDTPYFPDDDEYKNRDGLYITSYPRRANIFFNSHYIGTTPLFIPGPEIGNYQIKIQLPGYYPYSAYIYYPGKYERVKAVLVPITGLMELELTPGDALAYLDNIPVTSHSTELKTGTYTFTARKFGYNDYKEIITIEENRTTYVRAELKGADFFVEQLTVSRGKFNPRNPGELGKTDISFYVSNFGSGTIIINNASGEEVFSYTFLPFQTWYQSFTWNWRSIEGVVCPDGEYTIHLSALAEKDGKSSSLKKTLTIDSALTISFRNMWNGISGLTYVPTAEILPSHSFQIASLINIHTRQEEDQLLMRAPTLLSLRLGIGFGMEMSILGGLIFTNEDTLPFTGSIGIKKQIFHVPTIISLDYALSGKITYHSGTGADTFSNFSGLSVGSPFAISFVTSFAKGIRSVSILLCPEIIASPYTVTYAPDYDENSALNIWGYGRWGILFDTGNIIAGISGAIRTTSLLDPENFGIHYPLLGAFELSYLIPSSNTYITINGATEYESEDNYYLMGGFGLGFIY